MPGLTCPLAKGKSPAGVMPAPILTHAQVPSIEEPVFSFTNAPENVVTTQDLWLPVHRHTKLYTNVK